MNTRPTLVAGVLGAVVALSALAAWPWQYYEFVRAALSSLAILQGGFAVWQLQQKLGTKAWWIMAPHALIAGFWLLTAVGRAGNMIADVVTAILFVAVPFACPPLTKTSGRTVLISTGVVLVIIAFATVSRISGVEELESCIQFAETEIDQVISGQISGDEFCRELGEDPNE